MLTSFTADHQDLQVTISARYPELALRINGKDVALTELDAAAGSFALDIGGSIVRGWRLVQGNDTWLRIAGRTYVLHRADLPGERGAGAAAANEILAEMPGTVVALHVEAGSDVQDGDRLLTIESMKMQMTIASSRAGRIAAIHVGSNDSFDRGVALITFAVPESAREQG